MQIHLGLVSTKKSINSFGQFSIESKSSWLTKAFECNSSLHAAFWILSDANWRSNLYGNQTALQLAVNRNWRPVVELLIKAGADCRIKTADREETLLHQSIRQGADVQLIRILASGCDVNATDGREKKTALHLAAEMNRPDVAEWLIKQGRANLEAQDSVGHRPLHLAVRSPQVVAKLLAFGVDIGATAKSGMTPLHVAVIENQLASVRLLVKAGANAGVARDVNGRTPMDYVSFLGERDDIRTLLAPYASIDQYFLDMPSE